MPRRSSRTQRASASRGVGTKSQTSPEVKEKQTQRGKSFGSPTMAAGGLRLVSRSPEKGTTVVPLDGGALTLGCSRTPARGQQGRHRLFGLAASGTAWREEQKRKKRRRPPWGCSAAVLLGRPPAVRRHGRLGSNNNRLVHDRECRGRVKMGARVFRRGRIGRFVPATRADGRRMRWAARITPWS